MTTKYNLLYVNSGFKSGYAKALYSKLLDSKILNIKFLFIVKEGLSGTDKIPHSLKNKMNFRNLDLPDKKISLNKVGPGLGILGSIKLCYLLSRFIFKSNFDALLTSTENPLHTKVCFFWSKFFSKRIIIWTESWYDYPRSSLIGSLYQNLSKYLLLKADSILVHGTAQRRYCQYLGISNKKIFTHNFCSEDLEPQVTDSHYFRNLASSENKFVILYFSQLFLRKGLSVLIDAFKELDSSIKLKSSLIIAGKGVDEQVFRKKAVNEKNIKFIGYVSDDQKANLLSSCDIFVLPSTDFHGQKEGWGLVINEAASLSKPIITTDAVGSAYDLVYDNHNGYILENRNPELLREKIKKLYNNPDLVKSMGIKSRQIFTSFNQIVKAVKSIESSVEYSLRIK